jgi:hypothetical protein
LLLGKEELVGVSAKFKGELLAARELRNSPACDHKNAIMDKAATSARHEAFGGAIRQLRSKPLPSER